ncbi:glycoside hydrolase superfamily [Kockovaella imperatae]|uniref:non-reducing end alpha-L-arabinofuranosidase n=1 Tax=Kockovaella imperatae TaxID=4999 RepID=A0A1Y1UNC4_9TREE|nr:glycoside hydrolase superfamily [Kockovaella imperatae]ORX39560.1 glycoside hydrolase superfamily [Kockovaella imperatae]
MSILDTLAPTERVLSTKPNHPKELTPQPIVLDHRLLQHPEAAPVSSLLYSGFIEHLGRCIYGGVCDDPNEPASKSLLLDQGDYPGGTGKKRLGLRKDVLKVWGKKGDLECPMMRYPGGNFVSNYFWKEAVGPVENRRKRRELAWQTIESNLFGTDEFIDWCRESGCEPYLCVNMGTGSLEDALDWLEYCNGTGDTYWANERRKNTGREEPHNVKLWGLGNEMWGTWQVGHLTADRYAEKARRWGHALKLLDPTIQLVSCGKEGSNDWDREVLQKCLDVIDMHSIHLYSMIGYRDNALAVNYPYEANVFGPAAGERNIQNCKALIDIANVEQCANGKKPRDIKICFDEYNVWDPVVAKPTEGNEQIYTYTDMLGFCAWMNLLVRQSKDCPMACLAQSVNDIAPIICNADGILYQSIYFPFKLFSNYMKDGHVLSMAPFKDVYDGPNHPESTQILGLRPSYIDAVAVAVTGQNKDVSIRISLLNRHPSAQWDAVLDINSIEINDVEIHEIFTENLDSANTWMQPELIKPDVTKLSAKEWNEQGAKRTLRNHSWAFIIMNGKPSSA